MTPLDRSSDRAIYRQIADDLRADITAGVHGPGDRLPSESELVARYGVNRRTVQHAFALLIAEGLVYSEHGSGRFVQGRPPVRRLASDRFARRHRRAGKAAFTVEMEQAGRAYDPASDVEMLDLRTGSAPEAIAARLGLSGADKVLVRARRYVVEGLPLQIATSYVPLDLAEGTAIMSADTGPGGIYARLEESGHRLTRITEDLAVEVAAEPVQRLLRLPVGAPVIHLIRTAFAGERAVEVCDTHLNATAFELSYELPAR
ncbi:GntR family transcriptional regulator [Phytomonospora endophytica]|uniref:GntR family transcriptional regulator n=1 Tax=Phytomonospora endophytica TaxID=714109 RepID=A0A841FPU2_9ACTN|nr:GntR family transcriptional regulator [Phytomonospora endophytica]MBB6038116.1 GntR family transcriptional regulator [Phytomonospora endophytica]GIG67421.1 transcriptional regulator [Phytomonospora endophytica]